MTQRNHPLPTVEIHQAFVWTCDSCGRDNFERAIAVSPEEIDPSDIPVDDPETAEMIREWIDGGGEGAFVRAPANVTCPHCGAEFGTIDP